MNAEADVDSPVEYDFELGCLRYGKTLLKRTKVRLPWVCGRMSDSRTGLRRTEDVRDLENSGPIDRGRLDRTVLRRVFILDQTGAMVGAAGHRSAHDDNSGSETKFQLK